MKELDSSDAWPSPAFQDSFSSQHTVRLGMFYKWLCEALQVNEEHRANKKRVVLLRARATNEALAQCSTPCFAPSHLPRKEPGHLPSYMRTHDRRS